MDWPKRSASRKPFPLAHGAQGRDRVTPGQDHSARPPEPIEITQPELGRLENIEVVMPEGVEITTLKQSATVLPGKGRLIDGRRVSEDRISFTVIATTELGVKMLADMQVGKVNISPKIDVVAPGVLVVHMIFADIPDRISDANAG